MAQQNTRLERAARRLARVRKRRAPPGAQRQLLGKRRALPGAQRQLPG
jgi:hypothetical protein